MAAKRHQLLGFLRRSPLGSAILMTLAAVFIAGLLPLKGQASPPQTTQQVSARTAAASPDDAVGAPQ